MSRVSPQPATPTSARRPWRLPGAGCAFSRRARCPSGISSALGMAGAASRRSGIVALARTLLMALWRFIETGVLPDGAALKAAVRLSPCRRSRCETGLGWAAREETGCAWRTDLEKGLSTTALSRCQKRMQDRVVGVQKPTRIEGLLLFLVTVPTTSIPLGYAEEGASISIKGLQPTPSSVRCAPASRRG